MGGKSVYACRYDMGRQLARENPVDADMVIGVPDSGLPPAEGYAHESGIPFGEGLIKNRYVARTFIQPTQELRAMGVRMKLNPLRDNIAGKRLVVIDDSIVRGTTMVQLVKMLRQAGAAEVHVRINSPEVVWPCFYGIDTDVAGAAHQRQQDRGRNLCLHWGRLAGIPVGRGSARLRARYRRGARRGLPRARLLHGVLHRCVSHRHPRELRPRQVHARLRPLQSYRQPAFAPRRRTRQGERPQLGGRAPRQVAPHARETPLWEKGTGAYFPPVGNKCLSPFSHVPVPGDFTRYSRPCPHRCGRLVSS